MNQPSFGCEKLLQYLIFYCQNKVLGMVSFLPEATFVCRHGGIVCYKKKNRQPHWNFLIQKWFWIRSLLIVGFGFNCDSFVLFQPSLIVRLVFARMELHVLILQRVSFVNVLLDMKGSSVSLVTWSTKLTQHYSYFIHHRLTCSCDLHWAWNISSIKFQPRSNGQPYRYLSSLTPGRDVLKNNADWLMKLVMH